MPNQSRVLAPGPNDRTFRAPDGQLLSPPAGWACLPPGDAAATRRVKSGGPAWTVEHKRGRKTFSQGVWAPKERIDAVLAALVEERADPAHARKQEAAAGRRARAQAEYEVSFEEAVRTFLAFAPRYASVGERVAELVAKHATPVGSGTVARTKRIPLEERAEAAVIAWMRHQTTGYDDMVIQRIKGERRAVRRQLAQRSRTLLAGYRRGDDVDTARCPLYRAAFAALRGRSAVDPAALSPAE